MHMHTMCYNRISFFCLYVLQAQPTKNTFPPHTMQDYPKVHTGEHAAVDAATNKAIQSVQQRRLIHLPLDTMQYS